MNKRDVINYCIEQQKQIRSTQPTDNLTADFAERQQVYAHCKQVAAENGYVDKCFEQLWNKATDERVRAERNQPKTTKIKELRKEKGLTQTELAELAGTQQNRLGEYERGDRLLENMTVGQAKKIADALGVKIDDLIGR